MGINAGSAEGSCCIRVRYGKKGAFSELDVGVAGADFHRKGHLVLAAHDLEGAPRLEIYVGVPDCNCRGCGGGCLEQECIVELLSVIALHPKAGAPDGKCVRGCAVALVEGILSVQVSDRHELEVPIGALKVEMLTIPP